MEQRGCSEEGLEAASYSPFLESDSSRDPENGSCPQCFCPGSDKGTEVGDYGSRLYPADSVPEDPCSRSPKTAWLWSRGNQKGPIYDSRTPRQGCVLMSSLCVLSLLSFCLNACVSVNVSA